MTAGRESWTGSGMIDAFFDYWLPVFVHEMRRLTYSQRFQDEPDGSILALNMADAKYQEVHSEDGISRPRSFQSRINYNARDALTEFQNNAQEQRTHLLQAVSQVLSSLASTRFGARASQLLQGEDLHMPGRLLDTVERVEFGAISAVERLRGEEAPTPSQSLAPPEDAPSA